MNTTGPNIIIPAENNNIVSEPLNKNNAIPPTSKNKFYIVSALLILLVIAFLGVRIYKGINQNKSESTQGNNPVRSSPEKIGKLYIVPQNATFKVGVSQNLTIMLHAPSKSLDGSDVVLDYDPTYISIVSVNNQGKVLTGLAFPQYPRNQVSANKIYITGVSLESKPTPVAEDQVFARVVILPKKAGVVKLSFEFSPNSKRYSTIIENKTSNNLLGSAEGGEYQITQ